jgi:hypothetical protein
MDQGRRATPVDPGGSRRRAGSKERRLCGCRRGAKRPTATPGWARDGRCDEVADGGPGRQRRQRARQDRVGPGRIGTDSAADAMQVLGSRRLREDKVVGRCAKSVGVTTEGGEGPVGRGECGVAARRARAWRQQPAVADPRNRLQGSRWSGPGGRSNGGWAGGRVMMGEVDVDVVVEVSVGRRLDLALLSVRCLPVRARALLGCGFLLLRLFVRCSHPPAADDRRPALARRPAPATLDSPPSRRARRPVRHASICSAAWSRGRLRPARPAGHVGQLVIGRMPRTRHPCPAAGLPWHRTWSSSISVLPIEICFIVIS